MYLNNLAKALRVRYRERHLQPWFVIGCVCVLPFGLAAQSTDAKSEGATALSLVKQAMGGARWDIVRMVHARGKVETGELHGDYEEWLDLRRMYAYMESRFSHPTLGDLRSASGWNGSVSWSADQSGETRFFSAM